MLSRISSEKISAETRTFKDIKEGDTLMYWAAEDSMYPVKVAEVILTTSMVTVVEIELNATLRQIFTEGSTIYLVGEKVPVLPRGVDKLIFQFTPVLEKKDRSFSFWNEESAAIVTGR